MCDSVTVSKHPEKQNSLEKTLSKMSELPSDIQILNYKKGKKHGTIKHLDPYAVFGTAICILEDSKVGRLHIQSMDMPEKLIAGDIVFLDPSAVHFVEIVAREKDRTAVTFVF